LLRDSLSKFGSRVGHVRYDLSRREEAKKFAATVQEQGLAVDILVSCAGILEYGHFAPMQVATHESHINLNVSGLAISWHQWLSVARGAF
jgi:short-subunit dehydrogenase